MRSPFLLKERSLGPCFRRVREINPRTVCACHPVALRISFSVAPSGRDSRAQTCDAFEPSRKASWLRRGVRGERCAAVSLLRSAPGCMARQIRAIAMGRFSNLCTACTPGRLFQIAIRRFIGQAPKMTWINRACAAIFPFDNHRTWPLRIMCIAS
jgi:hypothetical protein